MLFSETSQGKRLLKGTKHMNATQMLIGQFDYIQRAIEVIEKQIIEHPPDTIDQRLRLRELQILYRDVSNCLEGGIEMFQHDEAMKAA